MTALAVHAAAVGSFTHGPVVASAGGAIHAFRMNLPSR
jgi:hypothetical protein